MSYRVTIIDNDTNEVKFDIAEAVAVIGAINDGEVTHGVCVTECNIFDILYTIKGAENAISELQQKDASVALGLQLIDVLKHDKDNADDNEEASR